MGAEARTVTENNSVDVAIWCEGSRVMEHHALDHSRVFPAVNVLTDNGVQRAHLGDTIIRHHNGSFEIQRGARPLFTE